VRVQFGNPKVKTKNQEGAEKWITARLVASVVTVNKGRAKGKVRGGLHRNSLTRKELLLCVSSDRPEEEKSSLEEKRRGKRW